MSNTVKKSALIAGTPYFMPVGVNAGTDLGNTTKLTATHEFEKVTVPNMQGGGGNSDAFERLSAVKLAMSCRQISLTVLEAAFGGTSVAVAAAAVPQEPHDVVELGALIALDDMQDMSASLSVLPAAGGTPYVEGEDYLRVRAGLIPISGGGIAAGSTLHCAYQKAPHRRVQALMRAVTEMGLLFDGVNERTGKPWCYKYHRVAWGVARNIEIIGEQFVSFDLEGEALAWSGVTDPAKSKFYEVLIGDAL